MSSPAEQYDRIERYLQGVMSPGELDEFQQKLNTDPQLASAVSLHRELAETLAGDRIHQFRKTLKEVDARWKPTPGGRWLKVLKRPPNLAIAASLLLLIGFFGWWTLRSPGHAELASRYFEQLPVQAFMNLSSDAAQEIRKAAHEAYIAEDYQLAAEKFGALADLAPESSAHRLYLGISQLGADRADEAARILQPLAEGDDQSVQEEAAWYLSLALLAMDDADAARTYLQQLVESDAYRSESARELINALE
jgi:TolA-binding protein